MNKSEIIEQLNKNRAKNISMIGIIENYGIENSLKYEASLLITVKTDHLWCYTATDRKEELTELIKKFNNQTNYFASLEDWMIPVVSQNREIEWELKTERLILPEKVELNSSVQKKTESSDQKIEAEAEIEIRQLKSKDADFIFNHSHYQDFTSKAYIRERIEADCSAGIFIKGELAGWGLTHDDGALGFIHVRENFRKRGFARLIMQQLIRDKRENKKNVFLNVEPDNLKAKKLFYLLGFEFDRMISWIKLKNEVSTGNN
jgi:ribosomal protein S18 acetylase RimI-like enzyme